MQNAGHVSIFFQGEISHSGLGSTVVKGLKAEDD